MFYEEWDGQPHHMTQGGGHRGLQDKAIRVHGQVPRVVPTDVGLTGLGRECAKREEREPVNYNFRQPDR